MESPHRQLRSRFANRLSRNDSHGFTAVHRMATRQITAVAHGADAVTGLAGDGRTHPDPIDSQALHFLNQFFIQQGVGFDDQLARGGVGDGFSQHAPQNPFPQRFQNIAAFHDRRQGQSMGGPTVQFQNDHILRHIHQTPG